ncbi:MAG: UDP-glucose/GDP-mannose dehydrogenase family protein, partial [Bacteroidetes bacterium]
DFKILNAVMETNTIQKSVLTQKMQAHFGNKLAGRTIAVWGLAFKPNTDDIREAPALVIIDELLAAGAKVQAFDPEAMPNVQAIYGDRIRFTSSMYEALEGAECLAIMTEWGEFRTPDFQRIKSLLKNPVIFDGRNVYDLEQMKSLGFQYLSIGRPVVK